MRARAGLRVAEGATEVRRIGRQGDLLDGEAGGLVAEAREPAEHHRGAEHVGQRRRLVVVQRDGIAARVGIVDVEDAEVALAVAMRDDTDATPAFGDEVVPNPIPGRSTFSI